MYSNREWSAHKDMITAIIPLHEHGCLVTVALDGTYLLIVTY